MLTFDESRLIDQLRRLAPERQAAFALSCASRLVNSYADQSSVKGTTESRLLNSAIDQTWDLASESSHERAELNSMLESVMSVIPDEDMSKDRAALLLDDASSAVTYAIRALITGDAQEAAWAARRSYEAVVYHLEHQDENDGHEYLPVNVSMSASLVQAELSRQERDLGQIIAATPPAFGTILMELRTRAQRERTVST